MLYFASKVLNWFNLKTFVNLLLIQVMVVLELLTYCAAGWNNFCDIDVIYFETSIPDLKFHAKWGSSCTT